MTTKILEDIVNVLKTITSLFMKFIERDGIQAKITQNYEKGKIEFNFDRFIDFDNDLNELMKLNLSEIDYIQYLRNKNQRKKEITEKQKNVNNKMNEELNEGLLIVKDISDKLNDISYILENLNL